ncbi:hypothetical protein NC652_005700 [Populus alba x Populus x berolinensis]|nr:hypothetical protein NC652_005700 [Populus alba x Populus x berolinensis]
MPVSFCNATLWKKEKVSSVQLKPIPTCPVAPLFFNL